MFAKQLIKKLLRYPTREIFTRSYSQEGEDLILKSMFEDRGRGHKGFYVDVGALHPYRLSNTAFFYEKGWSGINIEPTPTAIELFKKHRPRDINLNLGVGNGTAELTFYCFDEPALNSFSKELSEERHNTSKFKITGEVKIPISPLSVILDEHLPKSKGYEILERCEQLTSKYIILETPNGFVEQGPEFGNEFQRHLSGWFIHDFEGRGYRVHGTLGTRYFRGYAGGAKYDFPGCILLDEMLTLFLRVNRSPRHAFNLVAIKDVRGVPARLGPRKV